MRTTRRLLAIVAILLAGGMLLPSGLPWKPRTSPAPDEAGEGRRVFVAYPDGPLTFPVRRGSKLLRFFLNANLAGVEPGEALRNDYYRVQVEWLDDDGRVVAMTSPAHRLQVSWFVRDGALVAGRELLGAGEGIVTADSNLMYLVVPESRPARVRLRPAGESTRTLVSLAVRAYRRERLRRAEMERRLDRLAPDERERLAEASAYPWLLLSRRERRNAARHIWRRLAPEGNPDLDYREDRLLVRNIGDPLVEPLITRPRPDVLLPGRALTLPLRDRRNRLTVRIDALARAPEVVRARWYPRVGEPEDLALGTGRPASLELGRGMLELGADAPIRFELRGGDGTPREPEWRHLRVWLVSADDQLEYWLAGQAPELPLRIDARVLAKQDSRDGHDVALRYELLDAAGDAIDSGVLRWQPQRSPFAWLETDPAVLVSEPMRVYLAVPPAARRIVFRATALMGLAVYDRPAGLPRQLRVPEGLYGGAPDGEGIPDWFLLRPVDSEALLRGRSRLLTLTPRAPRRFDGAPGGASRAAPSRLLPTGSWRGVKVLEPIADEAPWSPRQFAPAQRSPIEIFGGHADDLVTPRLLLRRDRMRWRRIWVDGEPAAEGAPGSGWVELDLPPIVPGGHEISIEPAGEAWLNHVLDTGRRASVRLLQALPSGSALAYPMEREPLPAERVSLRVYAADPEVRRAELSIRLEGLRRRPGPHDSWTFTESRASIALEPVEPLAVVVGSGRGPVSMGRAAIELGSDLAACGCRLRIENRGAPVFVAVTRSPPPGMATAAVATAAVASGTRVVDGP